MPSINEISLAVNSLFLDITSPMTFNLNKSNLFKSYKNLFFRFDMNYEFEFNLNPIFRFDNPQAIKDFLEKEKQTSERFQEHNNIDEIQELINEFNDSDTLDHFYIHYTVEINDDEINVLFSTNSLIFKYEVIG